MKVSALDAILGATWAMEEHALEQMLAIAARENDVTPEALEAYAAKTHARADRARDRNGVAVLDAIGPLFKRANMMTAISGATSYSILMRDFHAVMDDPKVKAVVLNIDSPGGEASGTAELAAAIRAARGRKPIIAYVGGTGASAAYWLASAADKVVVDPTAILGSIGVQVAYRVAPEKPGAATYRFVSSQSPNKNPEIGTDAAAEQIQATIDAMAAVFVADVAAGRGVATETVLSDFGKGGIFVGQAAVDAGLADEIGSFESVMASLNERRRKKTSTGRERATMDDETFTAEQRDAAVTAAVAAERARATSLVKLAEAHGATDGLADAISANTSVGDYALALADAAKASREAEAAKAAEADAAKAAAKDAAVTALQTDEEAAAAAAASSGNEPEGDTVESVAAAILAA